MKVRGRGKGREEGEEGMYLILSWITDLDQTLNLILDQFCFENRKCVVKNHVFFACGELSLMKEAKMSQKAPQAKKIGKF